MKNTCSDHYGLSRCKLSLIIPKFKLMERNYSLCFFFHICSSGKQSTIFKKKNDWACNFSINLLIPVFYPYNDGKIL